MRVYMCALTNKETCTDALKTTMERDGLVRKVQADYMEISDAFGEASEEVDVTVERVLNVVYSSKMRRRDGFTKAAYMEHVKKYTRRVRKYLVANKPERVPAYEAAAQAFVQEIITNFDNYEFWQLEDDFEDEGMIPISVWSEDGKQCFFMFWNDGLKEIKC